MSLNHRTDECDQQNYLDKRGKSPKSVVKKPATNTQNIYSHRAAIIMNNSTSTHAQLASKHSKFCQSVMASRAESCSYSEESLQCALQAVEGGESVRAATITFGILKSTLHDHVSGMYKQLGAGAPTILVHSQEREIVLTCEVLAEMGFGLSRELVEVVVMGFIIPLPAVFLRKTGVFLLKIWRKKTILSRRKIRAKIAPGVRSSAE